MLVTPIVKFKFGLEAAGSASCKEKLLFCFFFQSRKTSNTALGACYLGRCRCLEKNSSELAADGHTYTDAETLKKSDISTEELEHLSTVPLLL